MDPARFSLFVTAAFFIVALLGMLFHEMWRDEHQAWLVARDAHSIPQVFQNMRYEGNPALWHLFLFLITRFTHDPIFMQAFHLLIACSFIYIFNRYAPIKNLYKVLFTFGYFPLYEYAVISRSYSLGILLLFAVCALYKNRSSYYILIGVLLALLANVTIYAVIVAGGLAGILLLDYFYYQEKNNKKLFSLVGGLTIFIIGAAFSLYQIWPDKDNSFPASYATQILHLPRWTQVASKLFTTYLYIPQIQEHFWNTNIYFSEPQLVSNYSLSQWVSHNPEYLWAGIILPLLLFLSAVIIFLRRPLILLLYAGITVGLSAIYYYTLLLHSRYCGYLLITLIACYWLAEYYPEKKYTKPLYQASSSLGKRISRPFLTIVLLFNVIGAIVAYTMDLQYKFSSSKEAALYIRENKLDTLTIAGSTDFAISPLATYLDRKIYYPQMSDYGSFTIWNKKRMNSLDFPGLVNAIDQFMDKSKPKILLVKDSAPQVTPDGKNFMDMERAMIAKDLQADLLTKFDAGIVSDEKYYIYMVQRVDSSKVDYSKYIRLY